VAAGVADGPAPASSACSIRPLLALVLVTGTRTGNRTRYGLSAVLILKAGFSTVLILKAGTQAQSHQELYTVDGKFQWLPKCHPLNYAQGDSCISERIEL
jgi:hypothetical protein